MEASLLPVPPLFNPGELSEMGRILVIEDDDLEVTIRMGGILQAAGYTVDLASGGEEARQMVGSRRPDLVLADLSAPVCELRRFLPQVKMVGTCDQDAVGDLAPVGKGLGFSSLLGKAFTQEELLAAVRKALLHPTVGDDVRACCPTRLLRWRPQFQIDS